MKMNFKEFVKRFCPEGTTLFEHQSYWAYFKLGLNWKEEQE